MQTIEDILARAPKGRPRPAAAARATIEARLGRPIGPVWTMPRDLRRAMLLLARQYMRTEGLT